MKNFFSKEQKEFALKHSASYLQRLYRGTEYLLKIYASVNDVRLIETMRNHQLYEYALLYQETPEYKEIIDKRRNK